MIIQQQQQPCPVSCTCTSIAMIVNQPVAEVMARFHEEYRSGQIGFGEMLNELGVHYRPYRSDERAVLEAPGAYLLTVPSLNLVAQNHNVVLEMDSDGDWVLHDPVRGREGKRYYTHYLPQNEQEVMLSSGYAIDAYIDLATLGRFYSL